MPSRSPRRSAGSRVIAPETTGTSLTPGNASPANPEATADDIERLLKLLTTMASADQTKVRPVKRATPRQHVVVWIIGVLLASLIPILFQYLNGVDHSDPPSLFTMLGTGQLLLIALVVTIAGIAEIVLVFRNIPDHQLMQTALALLGAVLFVAVEAGWYALLSAQTIDGQKVTSIQTVTYGSLLLFFLSALCSAVCVRIAAGAR